MIPSHNASCGYFSLNAFCCRTETAVAVSMVKPAGGSGEALACVFTASSPSLLPWKVV